LQIIVRNLQGKNYIFKIDQTYKPIVPSESTAVASKTKKNILVTMQVIMSWFVLSLGVLQLVCLLDFR
jgi:hypothetical protein